MISGVFNRRLNIHEVVRQDVEGSFGWIFGMLIMDTKSLDGISGEFE